MQAGLRIPDDIRLLTYSNKGIDIFSPYRLSRIEIDPLDLVKICFETVSAGFECRKAKTSLVKAKIITGETCGESDSGPKMKYTRINRSGETKRREKIEISATTPFAEKNKQYEEK